MAAGSTGETARTATGTANAVRFADVGVVEGFYGRVWSDGERTEFLDAIAPLGCTAYLYAPKHERTLGPGLLEPLDKAAAQRLHRLHHACERHGAALWVGLHLEPPFDPAHAQQLTGLVRKALQLTQVGATGIAVLFDDVPSARPGRAGDPFKGSLAAAQAHAFKTVYDGVNKRVPGVRWLVCPGRYTLDPVLEELYGAFEADYLARLHTAIPPEVAWLWTGAQVCSPTIAPDDAGLYRGAAGATTAAERPLVLWDNYPVNDGAMAGRLHLAPLAGRSRDLPAAVQGYLFNPLLQPRLGVLPGYTCLAYANDPAGYDPARAWQDALNVVAPAHLHQALTELAGLTRTETGPGGAELTAAAVSGNLTRRLLQAWDALARGDPMEPFLLIDYRRVMNQLQQELPAPLRAELQPWLGRLWRALRLFETGAEGAPQEVLAPLRAEFAEWHEEGPLPEVLGPWFP